MSLTMTKNEAAEYNRDRLELKALLDQPGRSPPVVWRMAELRNQMRKKVRRLWLHDFLQERAVLNDLLDMTLHCQRVVPVRSQVSGTLVALEFEE